MFLSYRHFRTMFKIPVNFATFPLVDSYHRQTGYKNKKNTSYIDLFLNNFPWSFHNKCVLETDLSDFHKPFVTLCRENLNHCFLKSLAIEPTNNLTKKILKDLFLSYLNELKMSDLSVDILKMTFVNALNSKKFLRADHSKFLNKELNKTTTQRTKLRKKFLKMICMVSLKLALTEFFYNLIFSYFV